MNPNKPNAAEGASLSDAELGVFVTAKLAGLDDCRQGFVINTNPLRIRGQSGQKYDCEGQPTVVVNPPGQIERLRAQLRISTNGLRHCANWNISEEKRRALMAVVLENEAILGAEAPNAQGEPGAN